MFLLSLLLASSIWLIVNLSKDYSGVISVRVSAYGSLEGYSERSINTDVVTARCRTSGFNLLRAMYRSDISTVSVRFDHGDLRHVSGEEFIVSGAALNGYSRDFFGEGADVEAFITDTLSFLFSEEFHKKVPVDLVREITLRTQYMAASPVKMEPDSVTIYGESAHLEGIDRVYTSPLTVSDVSSDIHGTLKINQIKNVRLSHSEVDYSMTVVRYVEIKANLPIEVRNAPSGRKLQVFPSSVDVVFHCAFPLTANPVSTVRLWVDYNDFSSSRNGRCVIRWGRLPRGVIDVVPDPEVVDCIDMESL